MIDTHSHIQFKVFDDDRDQVIDAARKAGVEKIIAVGTDLISSRDAILVANKYPEVFAAVGIHPHHVFGIIESETDFIISSLEDLLKDKRILAIGETGMDKYIYKKTKYSGYAISERLIKLQKELFAKQIKLAIKYNKTLIIHNREAVDETLEVLEKNWDIKLSGRSVFHFCEPDKRLLDFAIKNKIYIGVDADVLTDQKKQAFIKLVPLQLLVLETDSPFISPKPSGILKIAEFLSDLLKIKIQDLENITYKNSLALFKL